MLGQEIIKLKVFRLGLVDYNDAYTQQLEYVSRCRQTGEAYILCCEHPPVITLGRMTKEENLLLAVDEYAKKGISVLNIDRGGDITLHAPGQLVIYPIFDLNKVGKDLHLYIRNLEQLIIDTLGNFGLSARREQGQTGVWVEHKKIASIGIGVKKWVSYHGIGINVNTDLRLFQMIRPCGLDVVMTSMQSELGRKIDISQVTDYFLSLVARMYPVVIN